MRRRSGFLASHLCAGALALLALPCIAIAQPEGVEVRKSRLLLLPASTVERTSAQQYSQLMRAAAQKGALNTDRREVERLRNIARSLIPQSMRFNADAQRWRWEVNLIGSPNVNAFCMPGGKIAFFSGILDSLKLSDDEVAAVMGHEMAHALLEHGRARMSEQLLKSVGISVAAMMLNLGQISTELLAGAANLALTLPFSRKHETDADLVGMELAARAGFDPRAAATVWRKMQRLAATPGGAGSPQSRRGELPQFLSTHPSHESRIRDIEVNLPKVLPLYDAARRQ
jgi:Zn-dependent protease with chaperone function